MPAIRQLPPSVVNKIAAGEVIERPASVVKELMENAIDAGATRIDVAVEQGGVELVRRQSTTAAALRPISCRWPWPAMPPAKFTTPTICFASRTLGFRGEALASIAEVSRLVLRSRTADATAGAELEVAGGQPRDVTPCGCPVGTTIEVRQSVLQHARAAQVPPRARKPRWGTSARPLRGSRWPIRTCIARCGITTAWCTTCRPPSDWRERIAAFFGDGSGRRDLICGRQPATAPCGWPAMWPTPATAAANPRMQYLFLNGRAIRDRALQHALGEAYRGLLLTGRYPIAFLADRHAGRHGRRECASHQARSSLPGRRAGCTANCSARCGRSS